MLKTGEQIRTHNDHTSVEACEISDRGFAVAIRSLFDELHTTLKGRRIKQSRWRITGDVEAITGAAFGMGSAYWHRHAHGEPAMPAKNPIENFPSPGEGYCFPLDQPAFSEPEGDSSCLTPHQESRIQEIVDWWVSIVRCTRPAHRPLAEEAIREFYKQIDLPSPEIIWTGSPMANIRAWAAYNGTEEGKPFRQSTGHTDAPWLAHFDFISRVLGKREELQVLRWLWQLSKSCGWCLMCEKVCFASERHSVFPQDEDNELHCEDGPAVAFYDGEKRYYWHGVIVPEIVIENPKAQTIAEIDGEENEEVRRIRIERYGWIEYLKAVNAVVIDQRRNDIETTREILVKTNTMLVLVTHCPSTARIYALEIGDHSIKTCEGAQRWLHGITDNSIRIVGAT